MQALIRGIVVGLVVAGLILTFAITVLAPKLPSTVGPPDIREERSSVHPAARRVRLDNADGSVRVETRGLDAVHVTASIRAFTRLDGDEAEAEYAAALVQIEEDGYCLDIVSEPAPRPDGVSLRVDYTILAPEGAELDIGNRNGNVWIGPGCGRVTVRGQNTDIGVEAPEGAVDAASTNGRIRVLDAQGDVNVTTANGNVYIHRRGAGSSHATTINGAIEMHVLTPSVGDADLNTQNGDITLVLCPGCQMAVEASTAHGAVRTEIPVDAADGVQRKNRINGRIGGGGPNFTLQTLNGDIRLRPGRRRW